MALNKISLDTGSTLHTGTYVITEGGLQINIPRSVLSDSSGAEKGVAANPLFTTPSGGTIAVVGSVTAIAGVVTITGSTAVIGTVTITGSTAVVNTVAVTGNTTIVGTVAVTGNVVAIGGATAAKQPAIGTAGTSSTDVITVQGIASGTPLLVTGSTAVINTVTVTGSTTIVGSVVVTGSTTLAAASKTQIVDGSGNVIGATSNALDVNIKSGAGSGGTALTDDSAFSVGTTSTTPIAGTYRTVRDSVDDGDAGTLAMTAKRGVYNSPETPNGDSVCDDTNDAIKVVNSNATLLLATITGSTSVINTVTVTGSTSVINTVAITGSTTVVGSVTITGSTSVVNTVTVTGSTISVGGGADDGTTLNNPVMIGGRAVETDGTDPGSVSAEDDAARVITDRNRRLLVNTRHPNSLSFSVNLTGATTNVSLVVTPGTNLCIYLTDLVISNGATAGNIQLAQTSTSTAANIKIHPVYLAANGGMVWPITNPIRLGANLSLVATTLTMTTVTIAGTYYIAP